MLGRGNQWGKPHVRTRLLCTFPIFAISRAIPGPGCYQTSQHSWGTGYPTLRHLFLKLKMMCSSKSLLLAALMSVLLLHLCSKSEGKCCSFCQLRRKNSSFPSKPWAHLGVSLGNGNLLENLLKEVMGVVISLANWRGNSYCCLSGFFLCCQSQQIFFQNGL